MKFLAVWRRTKRNSDWLPKRRSGPVTHWKTEVLLSIVTAMDKSGKIILFEQVIDSWFVSTVRHRSNDNSGSGAIFRDSFASISLRIFSAAFGATGLTSSRTPPDTCGDEQALHSHPFECGPLCLQIRGVNWRSFLTRSIRKWPRRVPRHLEQMQDISDSQTVTSLPSLQITVYSQSPFSVSNTSTISPSS